MKGLVLVLFVVGSMVLWPICLIWALNTLFHTDIPFTLATFVAVLVIMICTGNIKFTAKEKG